MDKSKKVGITKIILRLHGKEVRLTPEEAKELKEILSEMFGKETVVHEHHYPYWPWTYTTWYGTTWTATQDLTSGGTAYITSNVTT